MQTDDLSFSTDHIPMGQAYSWQPEILWLNVISDAFIVFAYTLISLALIITIHKRPESPHRDLVTIFGAFVLACGITHAVDIWNVWHDNYTLLGFSKAITALISVIAAMMLIPRLPKLTFFKTSTELRELNIELQKEIEIQKVSSERLKRAEQQFETFIRYAPDGIIIAHPGGRVEYSNDMVNSMFGYEASELTGMWLTDLVPERLRHVISPVHNKLFDDVKAGSNSAGAEFSGRRKDKSEFPAEIRLSPIISGEQDGIVVTVRDISERKAREEDTHKEFMELAHVSRLSTVGQMAAGLAHELNQPLTAIGNNLHTAMSMEKQKNNPDPELLEMMQENYESSQRAGQIIHSLRQMVSKEGGTKEAHDINQLVLTTANLISPEALAASVDIKLYLTDDLPSIMLEAVQIQQVIVNLGRNAIEAFIDQRQSDGRSATKCDANIMIRTELLDDKNIHVSVSDNGSGLRPDIEAELFHPYVTSKASGMGLGLSICRSIIESHGGRLWHDSAYKVGTKFCFTIPITVQEQ